MKLLIVASLLIVFSVTSVRANCGGLEDGYHAIAGQCDAYVRCVGGQVVENQLCPDGLAFDKYNDPKYVKCKYIQQVDCKGRQALQQPLHSSSECPRSNAIYGNCNTYTECVDGKAYHKNCPDGLVFNNEKAVCDYPDKAGENCSSRDLVGFTCPSLTEADYSLFVDHARFPSQQSCSPEFFICLKPTFETTDASNARKLNCEYGELFNPQTLKCEKAEYVPGCAKYYSA